jgi:hypothetical protein
MSAMLLDAARDQDGRPPTQGFLGFGLGHVGEKQTLQRHVGTTSWRCPLLYLRKRLFKG